MRGGAGAVVQHKLRKVGEEEHKMGHYRWVIIVFGSDSDAHIMWNWK